MKKVIAIHPDRIHQENIGFQSFSDKWFEYLEDHPTLVARKIDLYSESALTDLKDASALLWRCTGPTYAAAAKKIIPAIEYGLSIPTLPSARMAWITRDKVSQSLLLQAAGIPTPRNWVFFDAEDAYNFLRNTKYPLVAKLAGGHGSNDVALINDERMGRSYIKEMFNYGVTRLPQALATKTVKPALRAKRAATFLFGRDNPRQHEGGYAYFQEFLPHNDGDTRITIIGNYATAFRRHNRPGDFRASGGGLIDWDQSKIDFGTVRLAHEVSRKLNCPFVAVDVLYKEEKPVVCELNFAYVSWPVTKCPGYWKLPDNESTNTYEWIEHPLDPERLTLLEFLRINKL